MIRAKNTIATSIKFNPNSIMNFIEFDAVPLPVFKEEKGRDWVSYGEDNMYPQYLLDMYKKSSKHNAILKGKIKYVTANGFAETPENKGLLNRANGSESLDKVMVKAATDLEIFNGFALQIIWDLMGEKIAAIYHIDFSKIRRSKCGEWFFYCEKWDNTKSAMKHESFKRMAKFNPQKRNGSQLLYYCNYEPGSRFYPIPEYVGCIPYIEVDAQIANFHLSNIKNNFWGGYMATFFNGEPTSEEAAAINRKFKNQKTGTDNAGKFVLNFVDPNGKEPVLTPLQPSDLDKQFDLLNKSVMQEILTGHQVTSGMLFGIKEEGQLGGRSEIREAFELMQNTYTNDRQQIIEEVFTELSVINGVSEPLKITEIDPISLDNVSNSQDIMNVLTSVKSGLITQDAALIMLTEIYRLKEDMARKMLGTGAQQQIVMSAVKSIDEAIQVFMSCGENKDNYTVINSRAMKFADAVTIDISELDKQVIALVKSNPSIAIPDIADALSVDLEDVMTSLTRMEADGLIEISSDKINLTKDGKTASKKEKPKETIEVRYSYSGPKDSKNRDFCARLLALGKVYTRKEIDSISAQLGYDVWRQRGGFYHNPKYGINTPYCRHVWQQQLVIKKG